MHMYALRCHFSLKFEKRYEERERENMENYDWYYNASGGDDSEGPVDLDEMKRLYKAKQIDAETMVWYVFARLRRSPHTRTQTY